MNVKRIVRVWNWLTKEKVIFVFSAVILLSLLYKDVFSERTLISNLEPFPDTFHYIVPARSLASGGEFKIVREFGSISSSVAPLYSLILTPVFVIKSDPRMFYFANVFLSFISLWFFYLLAKKLTRNKWIVGMTLFIYVTSFYVYWYPGFAMAENLILTLFMIGIYLLTLKVSLKNIAIAVALTASFYGTKYASAPLAISYAILYLGKMFKSNFGKPRAKKLLKAMILVAIVALLIPLFQYFQSKTGLISTFARVIKGIFSGTKSGSSWFSKEYVPQNLSFYLEALIGQKKRFLWEFTPILPSYLATLGVSGLVIGIINKKTRFIAGSLIAMLLLQIFFLSTFYAADIRYIYFAIPTLIVGILFLFEKVWGFSKKKHTKTLFYVFLVGLTGYYLVTNALRIKNQVVLNLKYAETPWYYVSVLELNNFFLEKKEPKPIVISSMPPYYIDYFSNNNYDLLPLSPQQEFRKNRELIWGPGDYSNLHVLYKEKILEGRELYFSTYGLGVESYLHHSFDALSKEFKLTQLDSKCYNQCRVYSVELQ